MENDSSNGASGNGHGGRDEDGGGEFDREEPTAVEVGGGYILGAGRRLAIALHGAGSGIDAALDEVESSPGNRAFPALEEIEEYLEGLGPWVAGALRAVKRIKEDAERRGR